MDALRAALRSTQRPPYRVAGVAPPSPQRSAARGVLNIIGLVLYTFVAVNALVLLELVPSSLVPSFLSKSATSSSSSFSSSSPPSSPLSRYAHRGSRIGRTRRRSSTDDHSRPPVPRKPVPAGPAETNTTSSAFLTRLPLELRQEVYRHVLAGRHKQFIRLGSDDVPHPADFRFADTPYRTRDSYVAAPWSRRNAERPGRLLALPLVSRQVYTECIALLYQGVVFKACRLVTVADLSRALMPAGHLAHIRELELAYEFRCGLPQRRSVALVEDADWDLAWDVIAKRMPGLRRLRLDLFAFDISQLVQTDQDKLVSREEDPDRWRWLATILRPTHLKTGQTKLHYIKRLNDVPWERPSRPLRWYTMVVMEALERMIEANWMNKRLDPSVPPFSLPKEGGKELMELWETCCQMQRDLGTSRDMNVMKW